jgi:hypothetical protein
MELDKLSTEAEVARLLAKSQISFRSRIGHLALLLLATGASVSLTSLLVTERGLPSRTQVAFIALLLINLCWIAYAAWVLAARRTMLFNHRVVAGWIALAAAAAFTAGAAILGAATGAGAAFVATGTGLVLLIIAIGLLLRARRDFRALQRRRSELEARLAEITP